MSLLDEARAVRERVAARLRELEPLVKEYYELRQLATEMGLEAGEARPADASPPTGSREPAARPRKRAGASKEDAAPVKAAPSASGEVGARLLEAVRAEPGRTVADYAQLLGVSPAMLYRPVRELATKGTVLKRARQLFPA
jgi:hypothetical protein